MSSRPPSRVVFVGNIPYGQLLMRQWAAAMSAPAKHVTDASI